MSSENPSHPAPIVRDGIERAQREGRIGRMGVCPDCGGRGWKLAGATARCERCRGTGFVGLVEFIAEAGDAAAPTRAEKVAQGLRELADWLSARPDMPVEYVIAQVEHIYPSSGHEAREHFLALAAQLDEPTPQRSSGDYRLVCEFTGGVEIMLSCHEQVLAPERPAPSPWPVEVKALAPDADWGDGS